MAARTRRLSSFGPVVGAADACAVAFITHHIGTGVAEINAAVHHPACGAGCGDRHGVQLLAPGGVRIRARNALVEPRRRDPRGGPDRRRPGPGGAAPPRSRGPRAPHRGRLRGVLPGHGRRGGGRGGHQRDPRRPQRRRAARRDPPHHRARGARDQRTRGGPLRLARRRELHDDRGRLRARHRRRQHPGPAHRGPAAGGVGVDAARRGAGERALPARREGEPEADEGAARPRGGRVRAARLVAGRRPHRRHRRDDPKPGGRGDEAALAPGHRRAGLRAHARGARGADRGARRAPRLEARAGEGHQVRPRGRDPRRRARARRRDGAGRLRLDRGDRGGPARGDLLRAPARRAPAVRRRARRVRPEPRAPLRARSQARPARVGALALDVRRPRRRRAPRPGRRPSASCSGPPACCTTSAWR